MATVGAGALVVLLLSGLRFFGIAHLAYLVVVVSLPMVGLALAARLLVGDGPTLPGAFVVLALVVPVPVGWYGTHVEPYRLRIERVSIPLAPDRAGQHPVRIGVLSDDEHVDITVADRRLRLGGNQLRYRTPESVALRRSVETVASPDQPDDGAIRILVGHRPDVVLDLAPRSRVDLTVAGTPTAVRS